MGRVAEVKQVESVEGGWEVTCDLGGDNVVTAEFFQSPGEDAPPIVGDSVWVGHGPGRGRWIAVGAADLLNDPEASPGDRRVYARNAETGIATAVVWLKADGTIKIEPFDNPITGQKLVEIAGAAEFVALSEKVTAQLQAIYDAIAAGPITTGDGGLALKNGIIAALDAVFFPGDVASEVLKSD